MEDDISPVGEQENDSKGAADDVDSWVLSMKKKLDPNHFKFSPFVICKVHTDIRKDDPGAYTPKIVSIGPFHRGEKNVEAMEELKMYYLNNILPSDDGEKERRLKKYLEEMKAIEPWVRSCYSEKIEEIKQKEFVEMMLVDGFFLIQLLFQMGPGKKNENPIYNNLWRLNLIAHDILLLENQLPFCVLERLCHLIGGNYEDTLWKRALGFYANILPEEATAKRKKPEEIYHLLHLIHMFFKPAASQNTPGRSPTPPGEQSSQENIEYTVSRQQSSLEVPLIAASPLIGSAPTHSITIDSMPPTPPGEQTIQEALQTLSGEQPSPEVYIRSGLTGSPPIYPITRPPASQGRQSLQELKHTPSSNIFSETLVGSSSIHLRPKRAVRHAGSALINPKTEGRSPPGLPGKQSSQELQHTQSGQQSFEYAPLKSSIAEPLLCSSAEAHHVTQYLRDPIPPVQQSFEDSTSPTTAKTTIPSATELQEAGVTFHELKKANNFLDVTFKQGKLEMPCLSIDDATNSLFRNFIAFEQCFPCCGSHFTSYCCFMDSLVNTGKDVQILSREDVIENLLGSDEEVALLFNKLCRGVNIDFEDCYLAEEYKKINLHTKKCWPKQRAKLMRDYFSNPWSSISVAAASLIIVLTLVQTIFTVFA